MWLIVLPMCAQAWRVGDHITLPSFKHLLHTALNHQTGFYGKGFISVSQIFDSMEITSNITYEATTLSVRETAKTLLPYKIGQGLRLYWLPVVVIFGLIGNCLSFRIMLKPHNRKIRYFKKNNYMII